MNQHLINHGCGFKARQIGAFQIISKAVPAGARYAAHDHDKASISVLLFGAGIETRSRTLEIERVPGVICSYALVFSTATARQVYLRTRRCLHGSLAILFGYAGIRVLTSRALG